MSLNKLHFLLGVLVTSLSVVIYMETTEYELPEIPTKTETIVHMVSDPIIRGNFKLEAEEINSSLNKCSVSGCNGQLILITSQTATNSSTEL